MKNQRTCGQGLAEHSVLPAKLGELIASLAENLELHMKALDLTDENSKKEHAAHRDGGSRRQELIAAGQPRGLPRMYTK